MHSKIKAKKMAHLSKLGHYYDSVLFFREHPKFPFIQNMAFLNQVQSISNSTSKKYFITVFYTLCYCSKISLVKL